MAKLVLSSGGSVVFQCFVDKERLMVGREGHNQIVIDDPIVSREHAVIMPVGNDHILEDLHSANGTFVNGTRLPRRILQHGDVMEFGAFHLRYLNPRASADVDLERTMLIKGLADDLLPDGAPDPATSVSRVSTARAARSTFPSGHARFTEGPRKGQMLALDRVVTTVGEPGTLAVVTRRPHGYFVTHVCGRRYPRVSGHVLGRYPHPLKHRDTIEVANETVEFMLD